MRTMLFAGFVFSMVMAGGRTLFAQPGLPPGDYQQTCRDMRVDGARLDARCQTRDGGWHETSVDFRSCNGSIINDDGNLRCGGGDYRGEYNRDRDHDGDHDRDHERGWRNRGLPAGDYQETCRDMHVNGDRLEASCQKRNGGWRKTSLDFDHCNSPIVNDNGRLKCSR